MPSPLAIAALLVALVALDAGARRVGAYSFSEIGWLPAWRALPAGRTEPSPYREGARGAWELVVKPGMPRAASMFLPPVLAIAVLWCFASLLALLDLKDVVRGTRSLPFVIASLSLCVIRGLAGVSTLVGAFERWTGLFFKSSAVALGLDVTLALVAIPCSDHREDEVRMALAGCAAQAALAVGFAVSLWQRRGLVESACSPGEASCEDDDEQ